MNVQTPGEVSDEIGEQLQGLNMVLYFFSGAWRCSSADS